LWLLALRVVGANKPIASIGLQFTAIGFDIPASAFQGTTSIPILPTSAVVVSDHRIELIDMTVVVVVDGTPGTVQANVLCEAVANLGYRK
jgi:hypothetical protein